VGHVIDATHVGRVKATKHLANGESAEFAIDYTGKPTAIVQPTCLLNPSLAELDVDLRLASLRVAPVLIRSTKASYLLLVLNSTSRTRKELRARDCDLGSHVDH
jgi:hypothetical protein